MTRNGVYILIIAITALAMMTACEAGMEKSRIATTMREYYTPRLGEGETFGFIGLTNRRDTVFMGEHHPCAGVIYTVTDSCRRNHTNHFADVIFSGDYSSVLCVREIDFDPIDYVKTSSRMPSLIKWLKKTNQRHQGRNGSITLINDLRTMKTIASLLLALLTFTATAQTSNDAATDSVTYTLGEIVVKANPRVTTLRGDALVTRIAGSQLEHAGTANDVLAQVPMVLGSDGNFEVFGKGTPAIYVNGRKLQDVSELAQISSSNIKNVEVLTNPGAKYDASVKAVINITLKAPQGDGFSGLLRAQEAVQKYGRNMDQINLKYRTGGLEIFGNFGYIGGNHDDAATTDILTRSSVLWNQSLDQRGKARIHDLYGKTGFSYITKTGHSFGAYYSNGFKKTDARYQGFSTLQADNSHYDDLKMTVHTKSRTTPKHHANLYYTGNVGKLGVDLNIDYIWQKKNGLLNNREASSNFDDALVSSTTTNHSRLLAEKIVLSYPIRNGEVEIGEEYTSSRFASDYATDASMLGGACSRVDENNLSGFVQIARRFGMWNVGAGVRYEHVSFSYLENGQLRDEMGRTYNNLYPSVTASGLISSLQMALSYTHKTQRPSYSDLDGTIDYINRFTFEGGNPYLKPEKIHNVQLTAAWSNFFGQLSYSYRKDPILHTTTPYGEGGEVKLITKTNFPKIQQLEAFAGAQFQAGIWHPKINLGIIKQWLAIDHDGVRKRLDTPIGLIQFQNAIHLPADIWLNIDLQWMSAGDGENTRVTSTSYLNAKLYKAFLKNSLSLTLEANDIFNKNIRDFTFYNKDVTLTKTTHITNRTLQLTLQYTFNTTRDRYAGKGAGHNELDRFWCQ